MSAGRSIQPLITVPADACGPAMLVLNPAQRAFVVAKVHFGCSNAEAARKAGYGRNSADSAKSIAYQLAHTDAVQAAINEEARKVIRTEGPRSIRTLVEIRDDRRKEAKDRIKAAVELLNRGGLQAVTESHVLVEHRMTDEQKDRRILELCRELGIDQGEARKMLIAPDVIDAEFSEVAPAEPLTEEQEKRRARLPRDNELRRKRASMTPEKLTAHKKAMRDKQRAEAKARHAQAQASRTEFTDDDFAYIPERDGP